MPCDTPMYTPPQPATLASADARRVRTESDARGGHFTTRRDSDSLIERIVLEHARSLRPSRRPRNQARASQGATLAASAPAPR